MFSGTHSQLQLREHINVHVIQETQDEPPEENPVNFRFDIVPFRQTFFRYSMYGQSEVVRSSSFVYASHHSSTSDWLDVRKLSVSLVGSSETPDLALYSPTVREVYFMGHIKFPTTAFKLLPQLSTLEKVTFNIGFGGYINEYNETLEEFENASPEVLTVTSLEVKMNHQLYRTCSQGIRNIFNRTLQSVLKHSFESFPNLSFIHVDIPNKLDFMDRAQRFMERNALQLSSDMKISEDKVQISRKPVQVPECLPFDPCARFPTFAEYNVLQQIDAYVSNPRH